MGNTLVLTIRQPVHDGDPLYWAASGSGNWDANDSGNAIWNDSSATPQAAYYQQLPGAVGDSVVFGDKFISGDLTVNLNITVSPASVVTTNSVNNYTSPAGNDCGKRRVGQDGPRPG